MKTTLRCQILNESFVAIGTAEFSEEEMNHFTATGSAAAKVCLAPSDIERMGLDDDDYVYVREM